MRVLLLLFASLSASTYAADYELYFLGGQSNMDGYGDVTELPEAYRGVVEGVHIFHGQPVKDGMPDDVPGKWALLQPGHGAGFSTNGRENGLTDRFGPELTFGFRLRAIDPEANTETETYRYPETDAWHYDSDSYVRMGIAFADAVVALEARCGRQ
jgi:hypothetical protein